MAAAKINLLVNLPPGFFASAAARPALTRAAAFANVRKRSWNTPDEIRADLGWADVLLMWSWPMLDDALLDASPRLRFSAQLDVSKKAGEIAIRRGFPVSVAKRCWSPAVAEMALSLTLSTLRKTSAYHAAMRVGKEAWVKDFPVDIDADERQLTGRSVGIVGFGAVGRRFAELLAPFGCELRIHDPYLPDGVAEQAKAKRVEMPELLAESDVVVLCAASNKGTAKLLGKREIARLRKGAVLVNVARSALVDTDALVARLKKGDLFAALDVFDVEPLPRSSPLRKLPNAFLTPHRAGGVLASVDRGLQWLVDDLEAFLQGQPRKHALTEAMIPALDG